MSFNDNVAEHLKSLRQKRANLSRERYELVHDCDCEYCDVEEISDEERHDEIEKEILEIDKTIKSLESFAELHKIPLEVKQ